MTFSILVRDLNHSHDDNVRVLAQDIDSENEAKHLISRLAKSYPISGRAPASGRHWFADGTGYHQIWAEQMARPSEDLPARSAHLQSEVGGYPRVPLTVQGFPRHLAVRVQNLLAMGGPSVTSARRA